MPPGGDAGDVENVLFILTDQQRCDSLGCYGNDLVDTPNLDRIATEGTRFDRAYTPAAICSPARASILTGLWPHTHGALRNVDEETSLADAFECYPGLLREQGYNAGHAGKSHVGDPPESFGLDGEHLPGWFYPERHPAYEAYLDEHGFESMTPAVLSDAFPDHPDLQAGALDERPVEATFTRFVTEEAIDRIERFAAADAPFYQGVHYYGPHNPYYLPEEYYYMYDPEDVELPESAIRETFEGKPWAVKKQRDESSLDEIPIEDWYRIIAAYMGYVTFIDDEVGRLLDELDAQGVAEETAVLFTSDHGAFLTAHKLHDKGQAMYEDIYNVPFLARNLGFEDDVVEAFVSLLDLAPTFCDLAGAEIPEAYAGRSLLELAEGAEDWRPDIHAEFHGHQFPHEQRMLRTERYKFVLNQNDTAELYDLEEDPHEVDNVIGDPAYGEVSARCYDRLLQRLEAAGDELFADYDSKLTGTIDL
jgi:arylsulfatase A-like enzyme